MQRAILLSSVQSNNGFASPLRSLADKVPRQVPPSLVFQVGDDAGGGGGAAVPTGSLGDSSPIVVLPNGKNGTNDFRCVLSIGAISSSWRTAQETHRRRLILLTAH
ncbi:hypothetical protein HRR83_007169 [Exophiala dermatitidis]|uniref:Uncharacterized protein n=1 Tax=Exophiala dermatitidis TaxID=5970 RepID=A0AAN6ESC7_EXODE|nr:hypothetical protein HRR73_006461 [Exophiala dermatitidis]KAJ4511937.1 hypothetical protein HRR74_006671 [Exophiala dermatitidis]KAJ4534799.1 hypothetical protein HRR76_006707 [Exophiala dermatitidis]KAJ4550851.1 hypothetical protein HRR77_003210 [Exophiala dermatitidis]KAJ4562024.1 hypothetical protein HRR79_006886 [Exophiala dermatitidis]